MSKMVSVPSAQLDRPAARAGERAGQPVGPGRARAVEAERRARRDVERDVAPRDRAAGLQRARAHVERLPGSLERPAEQRDSRSRRLAQRAGLGDRARPGEVAIAVEVDRAGVGELRGDRQRSGEVHAQRAAVLDAGPDRAVRGAADDERAGGGERAGAGDEPAGPPHRAGEGQSVVREQLAATHRQRAGDVGRRVDDELPGGQLQPLGAVQAVDLGERGEADRRVRRAAVDAHVVARRRHARRGPVGGDVPRAALVTRPADRARAFVRLGRRGSRGHRHAYAHQRRQPSPPEPTRHP